MKLSLAVAAAAVVAAVVGAVVLIQTEPADGRRPGPSVRGAGVHRTTPVPHPARAVNVEPAPLMFCEPWIPDPSGQPALVATVPSIVQVIYRDGTCEPDVDESGVAIRHLDGTTERIQPVLQDRSFGLLAQNIVWTPAQGGDSSSPRVITNQWFASASYTPPQEFNDILSVNGYVSVATSSEGAELVDVWSHRIGDLPITVFVDGEELRSPDGRTANFAVEATRTGATVTNAEEQQLIRIAEIVNGE